MPISRTSFLALLGLAAFLSACSSAPPARPAAPLQPALTPPPAPAVPLAESRPAPPAPHPGKEVVMYALGLMEIDYRFGGRNPQQGLDCSGMVSYIYENAAGLKLPHNASQMARLGKPIETSRLSPGDLVFFNTNGKKFSHVGIFLGDDRFIHAPSSNGKIKISSFRSGYYAKRMEAARTMFD